MKPQTLVANGIDKVFEHRKNFLLIGLTGRTGSGCSTAAEILATQDFSSLNIPLIKNPPESHEDRKLRIITLWANQHWQGFKIINVSALILVLALDNNGIDLICEINKVASFVDEGSLKKLLDEYAERSRIALEVVKESNGSQSDEDKILAAKFFSADAIAFVAAFKLFFKNRMDVYTEMLQRIGNNLRRSGEAFNEKPSPENIFLIPRTIEKIAELYRVWLDAQGINQHYIVIDALRHPYEVRYLSGVFPSFYTVAVNTSDEERKRRLHDLQMSKSQIEALDKMEYPDKIADAEDYSVLVKQNIQACLELADIYVANPGNGDLSQKELTRQLVRYVALMQHPGLVTPTAEERCMQAAVVAKANSGCISRQVGAVVTDIAYSIKAMGWNDVPQGQVPCVLRNVKHLTTGSYDRNAYSGYELNDKKFKDIVVSQYSDAETFKGRNLSYCFKSAYTKTSEKLAGNQVHTRSLHAEENAFLQIAKYGGEPLKGGFLFTTASPCELCAKKAYQLGIGKIFFIDPYPGIASTHILDSGTNKPELIIFQGAVRAAYHDLYQPVMAYKDELTRLIAASREADLPEVH